MKLAEWLQAITFVAAWGGFITSLGLCFTVEQLQKKIQKLEKLHPWIEPYD